MSASLLKSYPTLGVAGRYAEQELLSANTMFSSFSFVCRQKYKLAMTGLGFRDSPTVRVPELPPLKNGDIVAYRETQNCFDLK
jgi:hypothetical protein